MITAETLLDAARVLLREARHLEQHPDEAPTEWHPAIVEVRARASRLEELARSLEEHSRGLEQ